MIDGIIEALSTTIFILSVFYVPVLVIDLYSKKFPPKNKKRKK